jgi:hypothetical protein
MGIKASLTAICLGTLCFVGCGGGGGSNTPPPQSPTITSVTVSCTPTSVQTGQTSQCSATVSGTGSYSSAVTWSANSGTISSSGMYTAPATVPTSGSDTVKAISTQDSTKSGTATVTVAPAPTITSVAVSCNAPSVQTGQSIQCSATVMGTGNFNSSVNWSVNGVGGGSSASGTISATGLYTAPTNLPTPYTVSVAATSVADPTKFASFNLIVAGTIATTTQPISSATGGTITLPDGSSATIAPGTLTADNTVTLTEVSVPTDRPPNMLLAPTGPELFISFATPPQFQAANRSVNRNLRRADTTTQLAGISFHISGLYVATAAANTLTAVATWTDQTATVVRKAASSAWDAAAQEIVVYIDQKCLNAINNLSSDVNQGVIGIYLIELGLPLSNAQVEGLKVWDPTNNTFSPFQQCATTPPSNAKMLVVVHGMLSSVNGSYAAFLNENADFAKSYDAVYGIDYDWWNGLDDNGVYVGTLLDQIAACSGISNIDLMAHSEGVPVTLSALTKSSTAKFQATHLIEVAGPILGTPVANVISDPVHSDRYALLTVAANYPWGAMVSPPASFSGPEELFNSQFAIDLATNSTALSAIQAAWLKDPVLLQLPIVMVGGTSPGLFLQAVCTGCFNIFTQTPFDGVVGLDSAFGQGLDLPLYRIPAFPLFHTDMIGNTSNADAVTTSIKLQLANMTPPKLTIATPSTSAAGCQDSHWCFGPPGTVFSFEASGLSATSNKLALYIQDPTGNQSGPLPVTPLGDGTVAWTDTTSTTKTTGIYGLWLYDPTSGASNSVIETICATSCPALTTASVAVTPQTVQVPVGNQQQLNATVTGPQNTAVTWSVNGVAGGDSTVGTISSSGLYTAPSTIPSNPTVSVIATSQAAPTAIGTASVTIVAQPNNPGPTISSLAPSTLPVGSASQTIMIFGSGFTTSSRVTFNGVDHAPSYDNSSQLAIVITLSASDLAVAGTYPVVVTNPAPGGGASAPVNFIVTPPSSAPGDWTWISGSDVPGAPGYYLVQGAPSPSSVPAARAYSTSWTDPKGLLYLFGGFDGQNTHNDVWMFDPTIQEWTWVTGSSHVNLSGLYGTLGTTSWTSFPGARDAAMTWTDASGKFWLFGGLGYDSTGASGNLNDLWTFSPTDGWTWVSGANTVGSQGVFGTKGVAAPTNVASSRYLSSTWADPSGNLWLYGGIGYNLTSSGSGGGGAGLNDLWEFSPSTNEWTWVGGISGNGSVAPIYGTRGVPSTVNSPGARSSATSWVDKSGNLWLFGGNGLNFVDLNDLWEFNPSAKTWTWIGGANVGNQAGVYGTEGIAASTNLPGAREYATGWSDASGNFWLYGGYGYDATGTVGALSDLWEFNPVNKSWTWVSGSQTANQSGDWGTEGVPAATNQPGGRSSTLGWVDANGVFWIFGGNAATTLANGSDKDMNDLWLYQP